MMKLLSVALTLLFSAGFQMVAGIQCSSQCSACWKTGSPGVDIKIGCRSDSNCFYPCPNGYENLHCANQQRCKCKEPNCKTFGPCFCGIDTDPITGWKNCRVPYEGQTCSA